MTRTNMLAAAFAMLLAGAHARAQDLLWIRQWGTIGDENCSEVAVDGAGNAYLGGASVEPGWVDVDAFVAKYDATGALLWARHLGTPEGDGCRGMDGDDAGNVYIGGNTSGSLGGPFMGGEFDAFLARYDASGALLWIRQMGTPERDVGHDVAADSAGNVYITGSTPGSLAGPSAGGSDAYLIKHDASGNLLWMRQLGTSKDDGARGVAVDGAGNAYVSGSTAGDLGGPSAGGKDAFVAKYDASGALLWTRQLGTPANDGGGKMAAADAGKAYVSGSTAGDLSGPSAGGSDAFIAKYDATGGLLWVRQLGTSKGDGGHGAAVDSAGNVYLSGETFGDLGGPSSGQREGFVAKYDASGSLLWTQQLGTPHDDWAADIAVDAGGDVYLGGTTSGTLGPSSAGGYDAWLAKFINACYADCDRDGELTFFDFLCFQNLFALGSLVADCDGDGTLTFFDFLCFQNEFAAGCSG